MKTINKLMNSIKKEPPWTIYKQPCNSFETHGNMLNIIGGKKHGHIKNTMDKGVKSN